MITVKNLSFSYSQLPFIENMNFQVRSGEIFGFLGPSGAGKSTLQKILIGMLPKYKGSVSINNNEIRNKSDQFYESIGVDFEFPSFYENFMDVTKARYMLGYDPKPATYTPEQVILPFKARWELENK